MISRIKFSASKSYFGFIAYTVQCKVFRRSVTLKSNKIQAFFVDVVVIY